MPTGNFTPKPRKGPNGETWAGRGRKPKWLKDLEAKGDTSGVTITEPVVSATESDAPKAEAK